MSKVSNLKISVITVCRNSELTISRCIESIVNQTYDNIEYIVIDGASTDNTLDIIKNYSDHISYFISEKDNGIYDAMNKGLKASTGDYVMYLNADDYFFSAGTVMNIVNFISAKQNADLYYGKVLIYEEDTGKGNLWKAAEVSKYSLFRGAIPHPATIYRTEPFKKLHYDLTYRIAGDYELTVRAFIQEKLQFESMDIITAVFSKGGISTDQEWHNKIISEKNKIRKTYYNNFERVYYNIRWFFRKNF